MMMRRARRGMVLIFALWVLASLRPFLVFFLGFFLFPKRVLEKVMFFLKKKSDCLCFIFQKTDCRICFMFSDCITSLRISLAFHLLAAEGFNF